MAALRPSAPSAARDADRVFAICMLLCLIGLFGLLSAAAFLGGGAAGGAAYGEDPHGLFKRQAVALLIALGVYGLVRRMPLPWLDRSARVGLVLAFGLLLLVLVPGVGSVEGCARRWFRCGPVSVQPSEIAKLALIAFLAHHLSRQRHRLHDFRTGVVPPVAVILALAGLVALEPDIGTALLLAVVGFAMLVVAGVRIRHLLPFAGIGLPALVGLMALRFEHVVPRIRAMLDPMACYQTRQSLLALGSGHVFGRGLGEGRQKLDFLPQIHGDFLLAGIGEELGLVGCLLVLGLFAAFLVHGVRLLGAVADPFGFFAGVGVVCLIGLQAAMNIAVVTASVPPKGIALPFLSQGGTSLLVMFTGLAVLVKAGRAAADGPSRERTLEGGCTSSDPPLATGRLRGSQA
ncbi:MAG: FtsW/RodA/SpoVE family cell cycle protein [Planctomycetes bacterium]|nr:FtsW/RodA/SpoVE family cell cycle protein [Planctomycetota bacterium]